MVTLMALLFSAMLLSGCGRSTGGDATATPTEPNNGNTNQSRGPATFIVDADNGSDNNSITQATLNGGAPWQSIQHALDQAQAGDTIRVVRTAQAYSGTRKAGAVDPAGIVFDNSGEPGSPITLEGIADINGDLPVIDQGRMSPDATAPVAGLLLNCVSHVTIRGFEIRHSNDAGITTSLSGCDHQGLTIENNVVHDISGVGYVAGIRLVQTRDSLVRGNHLYNITVSPTLSVADQSRLVDANTATENNRIEHNDINNTDVAVHIRGRGTQALSNHIVEKNRIYAVQTGLLLTADSNQPAAINNTSFNANLVYDVDLASDEARAVDAQLAQSPLQSSGLTIALNTLVNVDQPIRTATINNVHMQENIITDSDGELLLSVAPQTLNTNNQFAFIEHNLYFNNATTSWTLARGGAEETRFLTLPDWQLAFSNTAHQELIADPDVLSSTSDPQFTDPVTHDYSLMITSPARTLGASGGQIGAYFNEIAPGVPE